MRQSVPFVIKVGIKIDLFEGILNHPAAEKDPRDGEAPGSPARRTGPGIWCMNPAASIRTSCLTLSGCVRAIFQAIPPPREFPTKTTF
jgi:hypothetical protein